MKKSQIKQNENKIKVHSHTLAFVERILTTRISLLPRLSQVKPSLERPISPPQKLSSQVFSEENSNEYFEVNYATMFQGTEKNHSPNRGEFLLGKRGADVGAAYHFF